MHYACKAKCTPEIIEDLVNNGADVHALDRSGSPALDVAIQHYDTVETLMPIVNILTAKGANLNFKREDNTYTLDCVRYGIRNVTALTTALIRAGADFRLVFEKVVKQQSIAMFRGILQTVAYDALPLIDGLPLLHYSAKFNLIDILRCLFGTADINAKHSGKTALHYAATAGNLEACIALVKAGADTLAMDNDGRTPLYDAITSFNELVTKEVTEYQNDTKKNKNLMQISQKALRFYTISVTLLNRGDFDLTKFATQPLDYWGNDRKGYNTIILYAIDKKADVYHIGELLDSVVVTKQSDYGSYCSIAKASSYGSPLHHAITLGLTDVALLLVNHSPENAHKKAEYLRTALELAAAKGDLVVTNALLTAGADAKVDTVRVTYGRNDYNDRTATPLEIAANHKHTEVALALIPHSMVANHPYEYHHAFLPVLYTAAVNNDDRLMEALLAAGADFNLRHFLKYSADVFNRVPIYAHETLLHLAARIAKDDTVIHALMRHGATPTSLGVDNNTTLHESAKNKNFNAVPLFIELGIAINCRNEQWNTALHIAVTQNNIPAVRSLVAAENINLELTNQEGDTALHIAAQNNLTEITAILLEANANVNAITGKRRLPTIIIDKNNKPKRQTPLHAAIVAGNVEIVRLLLNNNPDLSITNENDLTAPQLAISKCRSGLIIRMLLKHMLDNQIAIDGSLLHFAVIHNDVEAVCLLASLKQEGVRVVNIDHPNTDGDSPLTLAAKKAERYGYGTYDVEGRRMLGIITALIWFGADVVGASPALDAMTRMKKDVHRFMENCIKFYVDAPSSPFKKPNFDGNITSRVFECMYGGAKPILTSAKPILTTYNAFMAPVTTAIVNMFTVPESEETRLARQREAMRKTRNPAASIKNR